MLTSSRPNTRIHLAEKTTRQLAATSAMVVSDRSLTAQIVAGQSASLERFGASGADVIVTDVVMPGRDGSDLLCSLNERGALTAAIVLTGFGSAEKALAFVHDLRNRMPQKPYGPRELRVAMQDLTSVKSVPPRDCLGDMVGTSRAMHNVFSVVRQAGPTSAAVLISGETGTGKELVAREIHRLSPRRNGPFVAVNSAAVPEGLIESELFGHERGAFTGAMDRRAGCFEQAHGGTLLLDEIGEMPRSMQPRLLRVLEDLRVRRLGGKCEIKVDARVVASTNRSPGAHLREDLFYRLSVFHIELPPLRDRKVDLPFLADAMIQAINRKHGTVVLGLDAEVLEAFCDHDWPGNVRELRNVIERASIIAGSGTVHMCHLPSFHVSSGRNTQEGSAGDGSLTLHPGQKLARAEAAYIKLTLDHVHYNRKRAAQMLGISLRTLHNHVVVIRKEEQAAGSA